jgi:hypothetical protein
VVSGVNSDIPHTQAVTVNEPNTGKGDDLETETSQRMNCTQ